MDKRYLGLDYGDRRIGVAVSYGTLAEPLEIVEKGSEATARIQTLCHQYGITDLVIGQSEGEMAEKSRTFGQQLADHLHLPLHTIDETLSSVQVHQRLHEATPPGKQKYKGPIDHYAAATLLQSFLDELH